MKLFEHYFMHRISGILRVVFHTEKPRLQKKNIACRGQNEIKRKEKEL